MLNQKINELSSNSDMNMRHARLIEDFLNDPITQQFIADYSNFDSVMDPAIYENTLKIFDKSFTAGTHSIYFDSRINAAISIPNDPEYETIALIHGSAFYFGGALGGSMTLGGSVVHGVRREELEGWARISNMSPEELEAHSKKVHDRLEQKYPSTTTKIKNKIKSFWPF